VVFDRFYRFDDTGKIILPETTHAEPEPVPAPAE